MKFNGMIPESDKTCVIYFDELKVRTVYEYEYNPSGDMVRESIEYVQVAMAPGLKTSWKQPIYFAFDKKMTQDIIFQIITSLTSATYTVVAIVLDMAPNPIVVERP